MDEQILKNKIKAAVHLFLENDKELLSLAEGIHEQAISHRIAVYLECLFRGYHIDCEYNKHGDENKKIIENITSSRQTCECSSCKNWRSANPNQSLNEGPVGIRPDIIVHKERGEKSDGNILVIEVKKKEECCFDKEKLKALTLNQGNFKYKLGAFINFKNNKPEYKWFVNGKEVSDNN